MDIPCCLWQISWTFTIISQLYLKFFYLQAYFYINYWIEKVTKLYLNIFVFNKGATQPKNLKWKTNFQQFFLIVITFNRSINRPIYKAPLQQLTFTTFSKHKTTQVIFWRWTLQNICRVMLQMLFMKSGNKIHQASQWSYGSKP